jgi:hypothetical protein
MLKTPLLVILTRITLLIYQRKGTGENNPMGFLATTPLSGPFHLFLLCPLLLHLYH